MIGPPTRRYRSGRAPKAFYDPPRRIRIAMKRRRDGWILASGHPEYEFRQGLDLREKPA
jgi:hypothetical protein